MHKTEGLSFAVALAATLYAYTAIASDALIPIFNINVSCKDKLQESSSTLASCIHDELLARQRLAEQWTSYSKADKTICIKETNMDGTPSYVELQTCLEISTGQINGSQMNSKPFWRP